ncbi:MAG TPA: LLM class flavin-dependent oxidoreductase [Thermomicrobiales bacterium]|nr:LLM class flavin-dependent oxidoreductase [Thermomicrobiales bacterium]
MTATGLRFGIQTPPTRPWPELLALWRAAEALGFDSAWLPDHFVPPFRPDLPAFEAWTLLAALADGTDRIRLGVLVSCNTFRHPPLVAKEAVTIDHISGGRLELGLGAGWFRPEHEMFGLDFPEPNELVARFQEAVEVVDLLLRQERTTYDGVYYQTRDALMRPAPVQQPRPPLTLGAHGPRMMRIVAAHADRWNSTGSVAEMRERNALLNASCAAVGREPRAIIRSHLYVPAILPDERPWDSPDAFVDFVGRLREAGVEEFILQPPPDLAPAPFERIAREVIPALRGGSARS